MAKKRRNDKTLATAISRSPRTRTNEPADVSDHDIAHRAYELYLARGQEHGHDLDDWLQAERELRQT